jgi:uncharacterized membrane protein
VGDVIAARVIAFRTAVLLSLALLALLVAASLLRVASGAAGIALLAVLLVPLALPLRGLVRGDPKASAWATLCVTPYIIYGLTETIANPRTRIISAAILFTSLALFGLLVAQLRGAGKGADKGAGCSVR